MSESGTDSELDTLIWHWQEWVLLLTAWLIAAASYRYNYQILNGAELFSRSGSAVVMIGLWVEFRLRQRRDRQLDYAEPKIFSKLDDDIRALFRPSFYLGQRVTAYVTHFTVVAGTLIWGYGDLIYCQLLPDYALHCCPSY